MPLQERPPRTITCAECGASEQRSPHGPVPLRCLACESSRDHTSALERAHARNAKRESRSGVTRKRPLGAGRGSARL